MDESDQQDDVDGALKLIKEAHASGGREADASTDLLRMTSLGRTRTLFLERRGRSVWRVEGKAGADLSKHPIEIEIDKAEKRYYANLAKVDRALRFRFKERPKGIKARLEKADAKKKEVLALIEQDAHSGSGSASIIARKAGLTSNRVRQIRNKKRK